MTEMLCRGTIVSGLQAGRPCGYRARPGSAYCKHHEPVGSDRETCIADFTIEGGSFGPCPSCGSDEPHVRLDAISSRDDGLLDIVDRCRQHIAGLGADLSTIKAREVTSAERDAAADRAYAHLKGIDDILTAALQVGVTSA